MRLENDVGSKRDLNDAFDDDLSILKFTFMFKKYCYCDHRIKNGENFEFFKGRGENGRRGVSRWLNCLKKIQSRAIASIVCPAILLFSIYTSCYET